MNSILDQLKEEHDEVKSLFEKAENSEEVDRKHWVSEIESHLVPHARAEEKTLYASLLNRAATAEEDTDLIQEAYEEHHAADSILTELKKAPSDYEGWLGKLKVLKENVEHHIEEEEQELFGKARELFSESELDGLKEIYLKKKEDFEGSLPTQAQVSERTASPEVADL